MVAELPQGNPLLADGVIFYRPPDGGEALMVSKLLEPDRVRGVPHLEAELLSRCRGALDMGALAAELSVPTTRVRALLARWQGQAPGLIHWLPRDEVTERGRARRHAREAAVLQMWSEGRAAHMPITDNTRYHAEAITDAQQQFEHVETTVSHLYREPHPALGGRCYGEAFCDAVLRADMLRAGAKILEIGCGTGRFAASFLDRLQACRPELYAELRYALLDLSPELQRSQRQHCSAHAAHTHFVAADVQALDERVELAAARFHLIIANEMVGDLGVERALLARLRQGQARGEAERLVLRYRLDTTGAPPAFVVNTGAIGLLKSLPALLAEGAGAVLTEHGSPTGFPRPVLLGQHTEFTIHFGHLATVARALGMTAELGMLGEWLGFDRSCPVLALRDLRLLADHLLPAVGGPALPTLAYTEVALRERLGDLHPRISGLRFLPIDSGQGLDPFNGFCALRLCTA